MRARRRRPRDSARAQRLPTSRRACRRRSSFPCGLWCASSCSWARPARSRSGRHDRATPNPAQCRREDQSPSAAACARRGSRPTASALVASPHNTRCGPSSHRSPSRDTGDSGSGGVAFAFSSSSSASRSSISPGSNPVTIDRNPIPGGPATPEARASSSQSAQVTERFTISRKALTCAGVHSSQRITGMSVSPACARP